MIRQACVTDLFNITILNKKCLPISYSEFQNLWHILSPNYVVIVYEDNNELLGYLIGSNNNDNIHILSIGVLANYQSKGIGKKLLDYIKNENKPITITLYVHELNEKAINFYKKNNFKRISYIKDYYKGSIKSTNYNAFLMKYVSN